MLLMSSAGYIYSQDMDDDSSAKHGPFYVTNTMEVVHPEIKVLIINSHLIIFSFVSYHLIRNQAFSQFRMTCNLV